MALSYPKLPMQFKSSFLAHADNAVTSGAAGEAHCVMQQDVRERRMAPCAALPGPYALKAVAGCPSRTCCASGTPYVPAGKTRQGIALFLCSAMA